MTEVIEELEKPELEIVRFDEAPYHGFMHVQVKNHSDKSNLALLFSIGGWDLAEMIKARVKELEPGSEEYENWNNCFFADPGDGCPGDCDYKKQEMDCDGDCDECSEDCCCCDCDGDVIEVGFDTDHDPVAGIVWEFVDDSGEIIETIHDEIPDCSEELEEEEEDNG